MKIKAGEWMNMKPSQRHMEIYKAFVKTQKNNSRLSAS